MQPPSLRTKSTCLSRVLSTATITLFVDFGVEPVGRRKQEGGGKKPTYELYNYDGNKIKKPVNIR